MERQETPLFWICEAEEGWGELAEPGRKFHLSARVVGLLNDVARFQIRGLYKTMQNPWLKLFHRGLFLIINDLLNILDEQRYAAGSKIDWKS